MSRTLLNRAGFGLMTLFALLIAITAAAPYTTFDPSTFDNNATNRYALESALTQLNLYVHIFASAIALIIGPFQFVKRFRDRYRRIHRWTGRIYLLCILLGGLSALVIAPGVISGLTGTFGLSMLALLWLFTGWTAYQRIRAGEIEVHREWMIRNYALTFAAVTLRLWLGILIVSQIPQLGTTYAGNFDALFVEAYRVVMWLAWIPNLIIAEWIIQRSRASRLPARIAA